MSFRTFALIHVVLATAIAVAALAGCKDDPQDPPAEDPPETPGEVTYGTPATMPAEATVGSTSNIGYSVQGDHIIAYASARMEAGQYAVMHAHDTSDWSQVVAGDSIQAVDDTDINGFTYADYSMTLWIDIVPGHTYQVQVWVDGHWRTR